MKQLITHALLARRVAELNRTVITVLGTTAMGEEITLVGSSIWIGTRFFSSPLFRLALASRLRNKEAR